MRYQLGWLVDEARAVQIVREEPGDPADDADSQKSCGDQTTPAGSGSLSDRIHGPSACLGDARHRPADRYDRRG
jgi:hypothetical protein